MNSRKHMKSLRRSAAAKYLRDRHRIRCSGATLANHAVRGTGPPYRLVCGLADYCTEDLDAWALERISRVARRAAELRA